MKKTIDDFHDICPLLELMSSISALKERDIEAKLRQVTLEWTCQELEALLLSIFDNVATVTFHEEEYSKIFAIGSSEGEVVKLEHPVRAEGSVEIWLNSFLKAYQEAVHSIIRKAYHVLIDSYFDLLNFYTQISRLKLKY